MRRAAGAAQVMSRAARRRRPAPGPSPRGTANRDHLAAARRLRPRLRVEFVSSGAGRAALRVQVSRQVTRRDDRQMPGMYHGGRSRWGAHAMMDIDALREQTPGCARRIHLDNAGAALLAQPTPDAMTGHLRLEAEIGGYEAAAPGPGRGSLPFMPRSPSWSEGEARRSRCSTTPPTPGTRRSTPCPSAGRTGS